VPQGHPIVFVGRQCCRAKLHTGSVRGNCHEENSAKNGHRLALWDAVCLEVMTQGNAMQNAIFNVGQYMGKTMPQPALDSEI
jgi:hypothetical protein